MRKHVAPIEVRRCGACRGGRGRLHGSRFVPCLLCRGFGRAWYDDKGWRRALTDEEAGRGPLSLENPCASCGEDEAGPSGRCRRCERNLQEERDAA